MVSTAGLFTYLPVSSTTMYLKITSRALGTCFGYIIIACYSTDLRNAHSWRNKGEY